MDNESTKTIMQNAGFLMASQIVTWILSLTVTIFLPRYLGPEAVGKLHLASSLWSIGTILVTFGMDLFMVKEIARRQDSLSELLTTSLVLRALLYVVSYSLMALYANSAGYPEETVQIIYVIGLTFAVMEVIQAVYACLQGLERMGLSSLANILGKLVYTVTAITALVLGYDVITIAWIGLLANFVIAFVQFVGLRRAYPVRIQFAPNKMWWILKSSTPYMLSHLFVAAYLSIDVVIISLVIKDEAQIGWYSGADSLFGTMLFVPSILITSIFPALSRMHSEESEGTAVLMRRSFNFLLLLSIPIGLGLAAISDQVVVLLYGDEFQNSGPILATFGIVLIMTYQTTLLGRYLISIDLQNTWTAVMAVATVAAVPLDLFLIPWAQEMFSNGAIGGAVAYLFTEGGMVLAGLYFLPKGYLSRENAVLAVKAVFCGLIMFGVAWYLREYFIAIPIIAGAIVYPALILITKTIPPEEMAILRTALTSVIQRVRNR